MHVLKKHNQKKIKRSHYPFLVTLLLLIGVFNWKLSVQNKKKVAHRPKPSDGDGRLKLFESLYFLFL